MMLYTSSYLGLAILDLVGHLMERNATCMFAQNKDASLIPVSYYWAVALLCVNGLGQGIIVITTTKFIIAQTPHRMRGFVLTVRLALDIIYIIGGINMYRLFGMMSYHTLPGCGFYYYTTKFLILCVVMVLYVVVSRWYRLRSRNNPINIHLIADIHIGRYMEQEYHYYNQQAKTSTARSDQSFPEISIQSE